MDIEQVIRTILKKNPGIHARVLEKTVKKRARVGRSTVYKHLRSMSLRGKLYREKGRYWLEKPKVDAGFVSGLLGWWEQRARRKQLERERLAQKIAAPSLAYFRYRAEVDGVRFWKCIVDKEEELVRH